MAKKSNAGMWIALGVGAVALGAGVYFLTKSPSSSSANGQLNASSNFQPGHTYNFTAPLPPGMPIDPVAISQALASFGWTNITITSITPGTYSATATYSNPTPSAPPPGATVTLVS